MSETPLLVVVEDLNAESVEELKELLLDSNGTTIIQLLKTTAQQNLEDSGAGLIFIVKLVIEFLETQPIDFQVKILKRIVETGVQGAHTTEEILADSGFTFVLLKSYAFGRFGINWFAPFVKKIFEVIEPLKKTEVKKKYICTTESGYKY